MRLLVWNHDALSASLPVLDVPRQLVLAPDEVGRSRMVLVKFAGRGVVRAPSHDLGGVFRFDVDWLGADDAAFRDRRTQD